MTLTTATDELKGAIDAYGARDFRDQIRAKTRSALRAKASRGHATGQRVYGYRAVRVAAGHAVLEVVPERATVVARIFEMAAAGQGDRRIANQLNVDGAPTPGRKGWSKDSVRRALANQLYVGVATYGKKTAVADSDVVRVELPHLRVVTDEQWVAAQKRKQQTRAHYLRDDRGHLISKPESGLVSRHCLNGIARCPECGGGMSVMGRSGEVRYYFCNERYRRGATRCPNGRGVRAGELESAVTAALHDLLVRDPDAVAELCEERDRRMRAEQAGRGDAREAALAEAARLEREISNLVAVAAQGAGSPDIAKAINERRLRVEALMATPAPPPAWDRAEFFRRFEGVRKIAVLLEKSYPDQVRAAIRKLGVDRVQVHPGIEGWAFEGSADIGGLLHMGTPAVSRAPGGSP